MKTSSNLFKATLPRVFSTRSCAYCLQYQFWSAAETVTQLLPSWRNPKASGPITKYPIIALVNNAD